MASTTPLSHRIVTFILAVLFIVSSVGIVFYYVIQDKETRKQQAALNEALQQQNKKPQEGKLQGTQLQNFTSNGNITALKVEDTVVGTGAEAKAGDTVTVHYTGAVASTGTIFQSSLDTGNPVPLSLNQVIKGWADGIPGMKEGGKRRLYIPADQAYGANSPSADIPANAALVFDVELVKVGQ